jgi:hypothetical protein
MGMRLATAIDPSHCWDPMWRPIPKLGRLDRDTQGNRSTSRGDLQPRSRPERFHDHALTTLPRKRRAVLSAGSWLARPCESASAPPRAISPTLSERSSAPTQMGQAIEPADQERSLTVIARRKNPFAKIDDAGLHPLVNRLVERRPPILVDLFGLALPDLELGPGSELFGGNATLRPA